MMADTDTVSGDTFATDSSELPIDRANEDFSSSLPTPEEVRMTVQPVAKTKNRACLYWSIALVLLVALCVGLGVGLSENTGLRSKIIDDSKERKSTFEQVVNYVTEQGISDMAAIETANSPQAKAADWMAKDDQLNLRVPKDGIDSAQGYRYMARYVLAVLYYATDGEDWVYHFSFMTGQDICQWTGILYGGNQFYRSGVLCDPETGELWAVYLDFNTLKGEIPTEIGMLTTLEVLDFNVNSMVGTIPTELCQLTNIERFALAYNNFTSTIPDCIGDMTELRLFIASDNTLTGFIPSTMSKLSLLQTLYLDDNDLKGDISTIFNGLENLRFLYLEDNFFKGSVDDNFLKDNKWLTHLDLSDNELTGSVPSHFFDKVLLQLLDLHGNELQGNIPSEIPSHDNMLFLALHDNDITGPIPTSLTNLTRIFHLDLANNNLNGDMPAEIGSMVSLEYLFLANNGFTSGPIPSSYGNLTLLEELSLKGTQRTGKLPDYLGSLTKLVNLDLDDNSFSGNIPTVFGNLTNLEFLLLNRNDDIDGIVPTEFSSLTKLRALFLDNTGLTGGFETVCALATFNETEGDADGTELVAADCGGEGSNVKVNCTCCSICCSGGDDCNDNELVASLNPQWEAGYQRVGFQLGNDTRFVDRDFIQDDGP